MLFRSRDAPAYKFRSPIDDATAPQRILDHLLSLLVTLSAKDIVALSPLVQKELRQLVTTKHVDSASANEAAAIEADLPEFPEDPDGPVEVLIATTKPIESLCAIDAILGGKVKCECVVDNGDAHSGALDNKTPKKPRKCKGTPSVVRECSRDESRVL